ncbi:MAG: hypothetical protein OXE46_12210, partial [Chloroflexi bacterium]|nr:hypothetical protein [Chloroflexota bacterium]
LRYSQLRREHFFAHAAGLDAAAWRGLAGWRQIAEKLFARVGCWLGGRGRPPPDKTVPAWGCSSPPPSRAQTRRTPVIPLRIALRIQLLLLPLLLNHQSFDSQILGQYSVEYTVIIALNIALIGAFALLSRRPSLERLQHLHYLPQAGLAFALLIVILLTNRDMQWQAYIFLWLTLHSLFAMIASLLSLRMPKAVVRRFALGMVVLYAMMWLGALAVSFAASLFLSNYHGRIYTFVPFFMAWGGLAWGIYFGWGFKSLGGSLRLVRIGSLLVALWLGGSILANNIPVAESLSLFADAFDDRHEQILAIRATGQRDIRIPQPPVDLKAYQRDVPCIYTYYDIDSLTYTISD